MQKGYGYYHIRAAVFVLKKSKSEEAERLMIDYLINHDNNDINKAVVLSYWD